MKLESKRMDGLKRKSEEFDIHVSEVTSTECTSAIVCGVVIKLYVPPVKKSKKDGNIFVVLCLTAKVVPELYHIHFDVARYTILCM